MVRNGREGLIDEAEPAPESPDDGDQAIGYLFRRRLDTAPRFAQTDGRSARRRDQRSSLMIAFPVRPARARFRSLDTGRRRCLRRLPHQSYVCLSPASVDSARRMVQVSTTSSAPLYF
uniref:Uncharacterized protein n=1 Tax=Plectus sambesii TaxID=2011161 RepID=A0A914V2N5_9BILA